MSWSLLAMIVCFLLLMVIGLPIAYNLIVTTLVYSLVAGFDPIQMAIKMYGGMNSFSFLAVPFFVLTGQLMLRGGLLESLIKFVNAWFGRFKGAIAIVTIGASLLMGSIVGLAVASAASLGAFLIPMMKKEGYAAPFAAAVMSSASLLGPIMPPSVLMILYCTAVGKTSITGIFMSAVTPAITIAVLQCLVAHHVAKKRNYPSYGKTTLAEKGKATATAIPALLLPVIILGGIYGGIFTPTEAAAVAAAYGFIVGVFVYKEIKICDIFNVIRSGVLTTSTIMIVIGCAAVFTKVLAVEKIPTAVADLIVGLNANKIVILILINVVLLFVGCFMETLCAIMILAPIFLPIVTAVGVNPVHFGIIMVVNLAIGFITPPLGINLFVASRVGKAQLSEVIQGIIPFIVVMIVDLLLITYIPAISTFLPNLFMK